MNREKLAQLADFIERSDDEFDMCFSGTCIAAFAVRLFGRHPDDTPFTAARAALDLNQFDADDLFFMTHTRCRYELRDVRRDDAVRCLREAARIETIDWRYAIG